MTKAHSFHIPVMGIGFTIDSPLKVAPLGIDSVISLVDDILLEKLRKMYCELSQIPYAEITDKMEDFRAKRITSYLDLIQKLAEKKFNELKNVTQESSHEIKKYFSILPDSSNLKQEFNKLTKDYFNVSEIKDWVKSHLTMGSIDVNIMTKVDKDNYRNKEQLPVEFNDAHAALRGYAMSNLSSSLILSAGMNPRLYSYLEQFEDFYPNKNGFIKKKIVLKVSDYRSALIQGKFLAKKGLWVSEYRIESGLNCGGHAFATDGYLMGPILQQFKDEKENLISDIHQVFANALSQKAKNIPDTPLSIKITAQGGVGTSEEHDFILNYYNVDSVGWGSPFLLVPEATTVDKKTVEKLVHAKENDLYLSNISPLGIPFHSLKSNTKDVEKTALIAKGRPGSSCPKKFVALNKEMTDKGICTASRQYQHLKLEALDKQGNLSKQEYTQLYNAIVEKSCTCVGLGTSALLKYNLDTKIEGEGVSICPGPNMAYFSKKMHLSELVDHIYGRANVIERKDRPHMFVKELGIYLKYLEEKISEIELPINRKQKKYLDTFATNLKEGINYYITLLEKQKNIFKNSENQLLEEFQHGFNSLNKMILKIKTFI